MPAAAGSLAYVPRWPTMRDYAGAMGSQLTSVPICQPVVSAPPRCIYGSLGSRHRCPLALDALTQCPMSSSLTTIQSYFSPSQHGL